MACIIHLTQGKVAIVDDEDFANVMQHKWYAHISNGIWYAAKGSGKGNRQPLIRLHQFIMKIDDVDHVNRDGLDCRKENMRPSTRSQQLANRIVRNTTGYRGVHKHRDRYVAKTTKDGKTINLGSFTDPVEAAKAFDMAAIRIHGEFAVLNFDRSNYGSQS